MERLNNELHHDFFVDDGEVGGAAVEEDGDSGGDAGWISLIDPLTLVLALAFAFAGLARSNQRLFGVLLASTGSTPRSRVARVRTPGEDDAGGEAESDVESEEDEGVKFREPAADDVADGMGRADVVE